MNVPLSSDDRGGAAQPLLIVRDLKKHFPAKGSFWRLSRDKVQAVDGVSFSVAKGQTVGVVGESGCGKSATAKAKRWHQGRGTTGPRAFSNRWVCSHRCLPGAIRTSSPAASANALISPAPWHWNRAC